MFPEGKSFWNRVAHSQYVLVELVTDVIHSQPSIVQSRLKLRGFILQQE